MILAPACFPATALARLLKMVDAGVKQVRNSVKLHH
jgi:hypothetical protein